LGFIITAASFLLGLKIVIGKIHDPQMSVSGWTSLILTVLLIGGIQLISLGIIGLYVGRQYGEVKRRPLYIVADKINFQDRVRNAGNPQRTTADEIRS
jgi:glycosyltransferase involved in cell wall biosynthesis